METDLGALRLLLAILALIAFCIDVPEPPQFAHLVRLFLGIWVVHSVGILFWVRSRPVTPRFLCCLHVGDILWPSLITAFSHGPSSPFIPIFTFALLSAGFRWGFPEALLTALTGGLVLEIEVIFLGGTTLGAFEDSRLLVRYAYLLGLGYLIGTLGENEKERRAESAVITRMLHATRMERSMGAALHSVFNEFRSLFNCRDVFLVTHELSSDRVYLWQVGSTAQRDAHPISKEVLFADRFSYLLPDCPETFFCEQRSPETMRRLELAPKAQPRSLTGCIPALPFLQPRPESILAIAAPLGQEWRLRLILVNATVGKNALQELAFARSLFEQAASAIYGVYLVRRLRARASALERARVARELHDGAIQSLIAAEMRANILRRRAEKQFPTIAPEIEALENMLQDQVIELRELMQQLKPLQVAPDQLLDHLAEQVDRFRRDSGIAARFISSADDIHLSAYACREILLIVQEALINVRKHARAAAVYVSFGRHEGGWQLNVSDDGVGFDFEGTLTDAELLKSAKGPATIKERVANLGGELSITSLPSRGSQISIRLPLKGYFAHG